MFERFSRSWSLVKASADVLRQDKELLVFPLVSTIAALLVIASFVAPAVQMGWFEQLDQTGEPTPAMVVWMFAFYLVLYFVIFFFNAALIGAAMIRLRGGDPTVADGFRIAFSKIVPILGYAAIAATVGLILRMIEQRAGFIGKWITAAIGTAWTVATFMAVPVLVNEDIGPMAAVKKSAVMLKKTWGENIIGNAGIGLTFGLLIVATIFVGIALAMATSQSVAMLVTFAALTVVAVMILALVQAALSGIYAAAVYRYAEEGQAGGRFDDAMLASAFRAK